MGLNKSSQKSFAKGGSRCWRSHRRRRRKAAWEARVCEGLGIAKKEMGEELGTGKDENFLFITHENIYFFHKIYIYLYVINKSVEMDEGLGVRLPRSSLSLSFLLYLLNY